MAINNAMKSEMGITATSKGATLHIHLILQQVVAHITIAQGCTALKSEMTMIAMIATSNWKHTRLHMVGCTANEF